MKKQKVGACNSHINNLKANGACTKRVTTFRIY